MLASMLVVAPLGIAIPAPEAAPRGGRSRLDADRRLAGDRYSSIYGPMTHWSHVASYDLRGVLIFA